MSGNIENLSAVDDFKKWLISQSKQTVLGSIGATGPNTNSSYQSNPSVAIDIARQLGIQNSDSPVSGNIKITNQPPDVKGAIQEIVDSLNKFGITNPYIQAGILGVISKESGFNHQRGEISYKNTDNDRIRAFFGKRVSTLSDQELNALKKDDLKFWDRVYGPDDPTGVSQQYGNTQPGDGLKYRGRGYHGLTFKGNYDKFSKILQKHGTNVDLVNNPEILDKDSKVAADVAALYFLEVLNYSVMKRKYGNKNHNDFTNLETATRAASNACAGPGNNIDVGKLGEGTQKALAFARGIDLENLSKTA
jgi:predicted chitinase